MSKLQLRRESKLCYCQIFWCTDICHMLWDYRNMSWKLISGFVCYVHKDGCLLLHLLFHFLAKWTKESVYFQKISIPLPLPTEGQGNSEGRGAPKEDNFQGGEGLLSEVFSRESEYKIGELLINNSFSVEQAISYFTVTGVALIIFYLRSAKCFFHG